MITVEAQSGDVKQLSRKLLVVADGLNDFTEPLEAVGAELQKSFQLNFSKRGSLFQPGGWPARKKGYPWPLLEKTGSMRQSFEQSVDKQEIRLWNSAPHFPFHQSSAPRTRLPRRIMLKVDAERKNFIVKALQAYIVSLTRKGP